MVFHFLRQIQPRRKLWTCDEKSLSQKIRFLCSFMCDFQIVKVKLLFFFLQTWPTDEVITCNNTCNVKAAYRVKPVETYHLTLTHLCVAVLIHFRHSQSNFQTKQAAVTLPVQHHMVHRHTNDQLVKVMEHLVKTHIKLLELAETKHRAKRRMNIELTFIRVENKCPYCSMSPGHTAADHLLPFRIHNIVEFTNLSTALS